ncbi:hypothetical protein [Actinosynnema mirum]|uniref:Holin n=1 Tax=Actinosynnema mirum (strain ATCC 29888 / DSM 43827 / JCM 3225 / NBRC 14064 / NCIMB 13271 / NRRL B-12336 / IMRU 3971 / 101) TaxID=446462 RepID=C6WBM1_ACTMD|nr:hypothetical protein [Actinosynnema mirum]ACU35589.1 hypothetical protein Amir_1640 [Actinosynnema mirum DSM 43827]
MRLSYLKALVAGAVAGLTAIGTGLTDNVLTPAEWVAAAVAALGALGVVWAVPNKQKLEG